MPKEIKQIVREDIIFHWGGHAPYSVVKKVVQISKIVFQRAGGE